MFFIIARITTKLKRGDLEVYDLVNRQEKKFEQSIIIEGGVSSFGQRTLKSDFYRLYSSDDRVYYKNHNKCSIAPQNFHIPFY